MQNYWKKYSELMNTANKKNMNIESHKQYIITQKDSIRGGKVVRVQNIMNRNQYR